MNSQGCNDPTGSTPVPIQFESRIERVVQPVVLTVQPATIRVIGGYEGAGCGVIGAFAVADGNTIRLNVGPRDKNSPCDLVLVKYNYTAVLPGLANGEYTVEIYHRVNGGEAETLASKSTVSVP